MYIYIYMLYIYMYICIYIHTLTKLLKKSEFYIYIYIYIYIYKTNNVSQGKRDIRLVCWSEYFQLLLFWETIFLHCEYELSIILYLMSNKFSITHRRGKV